MSTKFDKRKAKRLENRCYSASELATFYGIHRNTMYKYLKEMAFMFQKNKRKRIYNQIEVQFIIQNLGKMTVKHI